MKEPIFNQKCLLVFSNVLSELETNPFRIRKLIKSLWNCKVLRKFVQFTPYFMRCEQVPKFKYRHQFKLYCCYFRCCVHLTPVSGENLHASVKRERDRMRALQYKLLYSKFSTLDIQPFDLF